MAQPSPARGTGYGWVKSFEVTPDREIIMTCYDPARPDQDLVIRALRMELDTMLRAPVHAPARRPGKTAPEKIPVPAPAAGAGER